uniref:zinc ribbon domain-containing protein n=1 Tax=Pedobacter schmidteae TaxID=2201271 RepID=UPI000EAF7490|nr:zinc ribbon domain-containing protein [Pedobacter schmidteae]
MNCTKCNAINPPEAKFCRNCGTNLVSPELQAKDDNQTIKSLLIIVALDYLLSLIMFVIQKVITPSMYKEGDMTTVDLIYKFFGWTSDIVSLGVMLFFLVTIKNNTVKGALVIFIVLRFIFMLGYRVFDFPL